MLIPDSIYRDNLPINSTNNTVCVGQQMNLTNIISGVPTNAITSWSWSIPGANGNTNTDTAIYDYEPTVTNSCYTNLVTPTNYLTNSSGIPFCNFYWTAPGTNQVSCTTVIYGQTNTVSATLNVLSPTTNSILAQTNAADPVAADTNYASYPLFPSSEYPSWLHFGQGTNGLSGINFFQTNSSPSGISGNFHWVQIVTSAVVTYSGGSGGSFTIHKNPGVDTTYPYDFPTASPNTVNDSPGSPLGATSMTQTENFAATMYLTWQASTNSTGGDKTVPVALRAVNWNWSGTATNTSGWTLVPGSASLPTNLADFPATNEPTWSTNATSYYITSP
jgi:hypothetical protein